MELLQRFAPKSKKEFLGSKATVSQLDKLLATQPCRALLVGPSGCGKTTLVRLLLESHKEKYDVLDIKGNDVTDLKALKVLIENFVAHRTIESFFSRKAKLVFFDDVDLMMCADRGCGTYLMSFVDGLKKNVAVSFIMTCSLSEERKLTDLKKKVPPLRMYNPTPKETLPLVLDILERESIPHDASKVVELVETYHGNIRNVLQNLHQLDAGKKTLATEKMLRDLCDATTFDITRRMLSSPMRVKDLHLLSDNTMVPLLLYENYLAELFDNRLKQPPSVYANVVSKIMSNTLEAEILERYMFQTTDWELFDPVITLKCGCINYLVNALPRKKFPKSDALVFTQALSKAATRHNYGKRLEVWQAELGIHDVAPLLRAFDGFESQPDATVSAYQVQILGKQPVKGRATTRKPKKQD